MKNLKIINKTNLFANIEKFKTKKLCAMVKSNAYGHGLKEIVKLLDGRVDYFGVVSVDEGIQVRRYSDTPVLICSEVNNLKKCKEFSLEVMVEDERRVERCDEIGVGMHLKINCGMNRYGNSSEISLKMIDKLLEERGIKLKSVYTHFPRTESLLETQENYQRFLELKSQITQTVPICLGGSGLISYDFDYDILRVGIGLYGYGQKGLLPVMSVRSYVAKILFVRRGELIGYGKEYKVCSDGYFAVVPVGYGDGLLRGLSGKFRVLIDGRMFRAVGNICMDCFFVKIDEGVRVGQTVEVMNDADYLAKKGGTISYEILTSLSKLRGKTVVI